MNDTVNLTGGIEGLEPEAEARTTVRIPIRVAHAEDPVGDPDDLARGTAESRSVFAPGGSDPGSDDTAGAATAETDTTTTDSPTLASLDDGAAAEPDDASAAVEIPIRIKHEPSAEDAGSTDASPELRDPSVGTRSQEQVEGSPDDDYIATGDGSQGIHAYGGDDLVFAGGGNDWVNGGDGNDNLHGQDGNDELHAGGGSDNELYGGYGEDELHAGGGGLAYGGADDDTIHMGQGAVIAGGGDGADVFAWSGNPGEMDVIVDFLPGEDHLDFSTGFFATGPGETLHDVLIALDDGDDTYLSAHTQHGWQMLVQLLDTDAAEVQARIDNGSLLTPSSTALDGPGGLVPTDDGHDWQPGGGDLLLF